MLSNDLTLQHKVCKMRISVPYNYVELFYNQHGELIKYVVTFPGDTWQEFRGE